MDKRATPFRRLGPLMAAALALAPAAAHAQSGASCALSATPLVFGQYVPSQGSPSDFTAVIELTCTATGPSPVPMSGTIALVGSGGASGRELADGPHRLRYSLFIDPARTVPWGDGGGDSRTRAVSGLVGVNTPFRASVTVYGRLLGRQSDAAVGDYTDRVVAVLNY